MNHNETFRFGSADLASDRAIAAAGFHNQQDNSLFFGFRGKKPLFYSGMGGVTDWQAEFPSSCQINSPWKVGLAV